MHLQEPSSSAAIGAAVVLLHEALQRDAVDGRVLLAPVDLLCQLGALHIRPPLTLLEISHMQRTGKVDAQRTGCQYSQASGRPQHWHQ